MRRNLGHQRRRFFALLILLFSLAAVLPSAAQASCTTPRYSYLIVDSHITVDVYCPSGQEAQAVCNDFIADFYGGTGGQCFTGALGNGLVIANAGHFRYNDTGPFYWLNVIYPITGPLSAPDNDSNLGSPPCGDACFGDPINAGTGNKFEHQVDYVGQGSLPLTVRWTYNSAVGSKYLADTSLIFGRKRTHLYSESIKLFPYPGKPWAYVTRADGKSIGFQSVGGNWVPQAGEKTRLQAQYNGSTITGWLFEDEVRNTYLFDASGRLLEISNMEGGRNTLTYNAQGRIGQVRDETGRALTYTYNPAGLVASIQLPDGGLLGYTYNANRDLIQTDLPGGSAKLYHYDEASLVPANTTNGLLTGTTDESGLRYSTTNYSAASKALGTQLAGGVDSYASTYQLTSHGLYNAQAAIGLPDGATRTVNFTAVNGIVLPSSTTTSCAGCTTQSVAYSYDSRGHLDQETRNGVITDHDFDARGFELQRVDAANDATGKKRTVQTDWHPNFDVPAERRTYNAASALVAKTNWIYNARGQALTTTQTDPVTSTARVTTNIWCEQANVDAGTCPRVGLLTSVNGPRTDATDVTSYTYYPSDDASCVASPTTCPHRKGDLWKATNALGQITETLAYDGAGRPLSVKDANGIITEMTYHPRGWLTSRTVKGASVATDRSTLIDYWPTGLVKKVSQADGSFIAYTYDAAHRLTDIADSAGNTIHYTLDNAGNRTGEATRDPNGALTRSLSRLYNQLGQLQSQSDAYQHATGYSYDGNGNTTGVGDALGRGTGNTYDPLNRLSTTIQDTAGIAATTQFQYDALDNLTRVIDPKGLNTDYLYNGLGDLKQLTSPDTGVTGYTYDSGGNRKTQTDARNVVATYSYDAANRLTGITYSTSSLNVAYQYDTVNAVCTTGETYALGRLTKLTDGSGSTQYCYTRFGELARKVQIANGKTFVIRYGYDGAGRMTNLIYPDGALADVVRDGEGRIAEIGVTSPGGTRKVIVTGATYAPFGPITDWAYGNGRALTRSLNQNYQPQAIQDAATGGLSLGFGFDAVGNLTVLQNAAQTATLAQYGYDSLNRLQQTKDGPTGTPIETYGYDATGNRLSVLKAGTTTAYTYPATSHRLTSVAGATRTYDAAGNTTKIGSGSKDPVLVYNDANRLSEIKSGNKTTMAYAYNGKGEQVRRYLGTASTYYAYDEAGHLLGEYDNAGAPIQQVLWLDDLPVGVLQGAGASQQLHYIEPDHLGTPRVIIDGIRNVAIWKLDSIGEAFGATPPNQNPDNDSTNFVFNLRYPGQRYDAASGLNYNMRRDYDSGTGRYVESDPIGLFGDIATYNYASNKPLTFFDHNGLEPVSIYVGCAGQRGLLVCDGKGGFEVRVCSAGCVGDCVRAHENQHKLDFMNKAASRCRGKPRGASPSLEADFEAPYQNFEFECRAHRVGLNCAKALRTRACLTKNCDDDLRGFEKTSNRLMKEYSCKGYGW